MESKVVKKRNNKPAEKSLLRIVTNSWKRKGARKSNKLLAKPYLCLICKRHTGKDKETQRHTWHTNWLKMLSRKQMVTRMIRMYPSSSNLTRKITWIWLLTSRRSKRQLCKKSRLGARKWCLLWWSMQMSLSSVTRCYNLVRWCSQNDCPNTSYTCCNLTDLRIKRTFWHKSCKNGQIVSFRQLQGS